jgi:plasmid segregation protein ParM
MWTLRFKGQDMAVSDVPAQLAAGASLRVRGDNYVNTTAYEVCMAAAVKAMNLDHIETLVVGTPVGNFEHVRAVLLEKYRDGIAFDERQVSVGTLRVIVQPVGGLIWHYLSTQRGGSIKGVNRLLVDVGYGTLDWVVANGLVVNPARSGSASFGVSSFLDGAYNVVREGRSGIDKDATLLEGLDGLLVRGAPLFYRGKTWQRSDLSEMIEGKATQAVQSILSHIGDAGTLQSVVLMGGGAPLFQSALAAAFRPIEVEVIASARFANVKGFQSVAERGA